MANTDWRQRLGRFIAGGNFTGDTLHDIALDYGYPEDVDFEHFYNMYRRFGIAKNIIELPVDTCWSTNPSIESESPSFNDEMNELRLRVKLWQRLKGLDCRQRIGRYAGLYVQVRDGKRPSEPMDKVGGGIGAIVKVTPLYESQLEITQIDENPNSETYGRPILLQYNGSAAGDLSERATSTQTIHASRIIFAAEGADDGSIYGIPSLESVFNSLMDLRKIIGAGGEGFYRNAAQSIVFNLDKDAQADVSVLEQFNEQFDNFTRDRMRRGMWTPNMTANTLESNLSNPKDFFTSALNDVAAGSKIPATILIGQQTGRLASQEDSANFLSLMQSRRVNFCSSMAESFIDWCMSYNVLPFVEYAVEWDDLLARSDDDRLAIAAKMSEVNERQFRSGGGIAFDADEIREAAGYEHENLEMPSESLDELDDEQKDT